jgi:hypothetical protein
MSNSAAHRSRRGLTGLLGSEGGVNESNGLGSVDVLRVGVLGRSCPGCPAGELYKRWRSLEYIRSPLQKLT